MNFWNKKTKTPFFHVILSKNPTVIWQATNYCVLIACMKLSILYLVDKWFRMLLISFYENWSNAVDDKNCLVCFYSFPTPTVHISTWITFWNIYRYISICIFDTSDGMLIRSVCWMIESQYRVQTDRQTDTACDYIHCTFPCFLSFLLFSSFVVVLLPLLTLLLWYVVSCLSTLYLSMCIQGGSKMSYLQHCLTWVLDISISGFVQ